MRKSTVPYADRHKKIRVRWNIQKKTKAVEELILGWSSPVTCCEVRAHIHQRVRDNRIVSINGSASRISTIKRK
jgi:hypothetical protein